MTELTPLPDVLRACLSEAGESVDPLTNAELDAFLDTYQGGGCGRDGCLHVVTGPVTQFRGDVGGDAGRHDSLVKVAPWAMAEAMAGCYPAREAFGTLHAAFVETFTKDPDRARLSQLGDEFVRIIQWAAAVAQTDPDRAHRNDDLPTDAELEAFWSARPELAQTRQFARARCVGPWSTFGAVLARVVATIPPHVVLPAIVGSEASLNLFVALVAPSGFGKNASEAAADDLVASEKYVFVATPGSGEGILKQYGYVKKASKGQEPKQVNLRNAVMFTVGEVDTFAALTTRGGSTLMPELRKAWMGERLGFGWATAEKAVVVMGHRYRMTMVIGVQPGRGAALLNDSDGGTPQRVIWLRTTDPDAPDEPPEEPELLRLPEWPSCGPKLEVVETDPDDGSGLKVKFGPEQDAHQLQVPADKSAFHVLELPPSVVEVIQQEQRAKLRGEVPETEALDGHKMLCRLKVAAGLMCMNGRTDKINEEDWDLAGVVMKVSNATRAEVQKVLSTNRKREDAARGRSDAVREVAKADAIDAMVDKKIARIADGIRQKLRDENHQSLRDLKKRFRGPDRKHIWPALELLQRVGDVELEQIEYHGNPGHIAHLKERR